MRSLEADSNGSSERTEALYREHRAAVAALCRSLLRDRPEAEDATQQVFLSAHRALLNGAAPREPLAWLLAVARHECYARFRQRPTAPLPTGEAAVAATADTSAQVLRAGQVASMWDEVRRMPAAQREAFLLREIRGLSYGQLAAELSLSPPSVRSLLLRARTRLRTRLGDVVAAFGGVPWVQALIRVVAGADGASPVPAATKAAVVGLGALALASGGDVPRIAHHAPRSHARTARAGAHRVGKAHVSRLATPSPVAAAPTADRSGRDGESGDGTTATTPVVQQKTDSRDGGGGSSSGTTSGSDGSSGETTTTTTTTTTQSTSGGGDGSDHSGSGSDGSSGSVTTTTSSDSGSGGGGSDGG